VLGRICVVLVLSGDCLAGDRGEQDRPEEEREGVLAQEPHWWFAIPIAI
jgi:hypothetical protein